MISNVFAVTVQCGGRVKPTFETLTWLWVTVSGRAKVRIAARAYTISTRTVAAEVAATMLLLHYYYIPYIPMYNVIYFITD